MITKQIISAALCSSILGGCAIHPLPEDISGLDTYYIARIIRCEAKWGILNESIALLKDNNLTEGELKLRSFVENVLKDKKNERFILDRTGIRAEIEGSDPKYFKTSASFNDALRKYKDIKMILDFTFDMKEQNKLETNVGIIDKIPIGPIGVGLGTLNDRQRHNTRNFDIVESFEDMLSDKNLDRTGAYKAPNFNYPIAGEIGLKDVVKNYVDLNELAVLKHGLSKLDNVVFAETLEFTTEVQGTINPSIVLSPVASGLGVGSAGFTATGNRKDLNKVIVAIADESSVTGQKTQSMQKTSAARDRRLPGYAVRTLLPSPTVPATSSNRTDEVLREAVQNQIQRSLLNALQQRLTGP